MHHNHCHHHASHDPPARAAGGPAAGHQGHNAHAGHSVVDFRRRFWISLALSVPVLVFSPSIQELLNYQLEFAGSRWLIFILAAFIYFYGGRPFLVGLWRELKNRQPGMMTLVGVAISAAFGWSLAVFTGFPGEQLLWELVTLIDIMLLGHWIEMKSVLGASRALEELARLLPAAAHLVKEDDQIEDVAVEELKVGDLVLVKPGEKIPVDGKVEEGMTSVNASMLTGESKLVEKKTGSEVIGGSINGDGSIKVKINKIGKDTYLSQIIELVRKAQASKSRMQNLANRAAVWLTGIALSGGVLTLFSWLFFTTQDLAFAIERTIAVIVIACPHALGLAVPLVVAVSTTLSARSGLLIRNRTAFEEARRLDAVILDKTGTLTRGEFGVTDVIAAAGFNQTEILNLAAAVEAHSEHPIAKAIVSPFKKPAPVENFKTLPGKGAEGEVLGKKIKVVSPSYLSELSLASSDSKMSVLLEEGKTVVFVVVDGKLAGAIGLDDVVRPESKEAVRRFREMGIKTVMLTGDNEAVAARVAKEIGVDEYFAGVLPEQKSQKVTEVQKRGFSVAMVGDGVNDAPALAAADVGIAIGAGTNVAIETADIILVRSNPLDAVKIIELSRKTYRKMIQNLWWASGYNIVALPLAAGVLAGLGILLSPAVGAIFMSLSTVIVAFNAVSLKRVEAKLKI